MLMAFRNVSIAAKLSGGGALVVALIVGIAYWTYSAFDRVRTDTALSQRAAQVASTTQELQARFMSVAYANLAIATTGSVEDLKRFEAMSARDRERSLALIDRAIATSTRPDRQAALRDAREMMQRYSELTERGITARRHFLTASEQDYRSARLLLAQEISTAVGMTETDSPSGAAIRAYERAMRTAVDMAAIFLSTGADGDAATAGQAVAALSDPAIALDQLAVTVPKLRDVTAIHAAFAKALQEVIASRQVNDRIWFGEARPLRLVMQDQLTAIAEAAQAYSTELADDAVLTTDVAVRGTLTIIVALVALVVIINGALYRMIATPVVRLTGVMRASSH